MQLKMMGTSQAFTLVRVLRWSVLPVLFLTLPALAQQSGQQTAQQTAEVAARQGQAGVPGAGALPATEPGVQDTGQVAAAPEPVADGFSTEVAVNGQSQDELLSAYRVAMRIVLLQNSSDKSLLNYDAVRRALVQAGDFIDSSVYRVPDVNEQITRATPLTPKVRRSNEATHLVQVRFNRELISGLIADQMASVPEADEDAEVEPQVPTSALVWLLIDDGNGEHRIGGPTGRNVIERVHEIAGGVGQRLAFPGQDALDLQALSALDLQSGNQQRILDASRRYNEEVVLAGVLKRSEGRYWSANWSRYFQDSVLDYNDSAASLDQALQQGIRWLASVARVDAEGEGQPELAGSESAGQYQGAQGLDTGASFFGRRRDSNSSLLWVSSLQSPDAYAAVLQLIEEVESVSLVYPSDVMPDGVMFSISPRFALNDVAFRLSDVPWLRASGPNSPALSQPAMQADLNYELLR